MAVSVVISLFLSARVGGDLSGFVFNLDNEAREVGPRRSFLQKPEPTPYGALGVPPAVHLLSVNQWFVVAAEPPA
jgi:hypothetical protein